MYLGAAVPLRQGGNGLAREEQPVDWSLFGCARQGHVTYAPDEPDLRDRLMTHTVGGRRGGAFAAVRS